ncbi:MarR family winged helix-turn-helix transcriptional regulator [Streptomyces sp. NPDC059578]|uniref:MarR family winged helix-turn-helix transcriptional regulator n=1 Tax=Streptomyces sp. NPDC059578 TaxID=3346874 RepID=UPI0036C975BD
MSGAEPVVSRGFKVGVWRAYMEVHNEVLSAIERELAQRHRLSVSEFDVLVNIPLDGTRLKDLKQRVVLTQSAISRLFDRLAERGLVFRSPLAEDQRGAVVKLTEEGRKVLRAAVRTNTEVVERTFAGKLSTEELRALHGIVTRLKGTGAPDA